MANSQQHSKDDQIVIVGAGVFGLGLANELARNRGYTNITVLDRAPPPVPDGSSVDVSRIIRTEYANPLYARIAKEALAGWRKDYSDHFHECGFVILVESDQNPYAAKVIEQGKINNTKAQVFPAANTPAEVKKLYPSVQARMEGFTSVHNPEGGWADAGESIRALAQKAREAGVRFATGTSGTVTGLELDPAGRRVVGVRVLSGGVVPASRVVLATGAWTNTLAPGVSHALAASAQPIGFVQLTPREAADVSAHPVLMSMVSGVFCFPPTRDGLLKLARHGYGYATSLPAGHGGGVVSAPHRDKDNSRSRFLPADADEALREGLRQFFPRLGDRPWLRTRLCWYTDTPESDFIADDHPEVEGLFLATGGSGQ